jgi:hypothetical protein
VSHDRDEDVVAELLVIGRHAHGDGRREQEQHLPACVQPERAAVPELEPVVEEPDRTARVRGAEDRERRHGVDARGEERDRRREHDQEPAHRRRALLDRVVLRALLADLLAELVAAQEVDERGPGEQGDDQRHQRRDEDACHYRVSFAATASSPTAREPFTSKTRRPADERREGVAGLVGRRHGAAAVPLGEAGRPHADHLDAELAREPADVAVVLGRSRPELGHLAEDRDASPGPGPLGEVLESRAHRERVRVVAVVQEQHAVGELELLLAERRELDLEPPIRDGDAERVADGERGEGVPQLVARREARLEPNRAPPTSTR